MYENGVPNVQYQIPMVPANYGPAPYQGNGNDMFGGNWMWFLLVWMAMFGWGGNGFGFGGNNAGAGYRVDADIQRGFDQNAVMNKLDTMQQGQCAGFAGVNQNISTTGNQVAMAIANGFSQAEIAANARQMADMNQNFAMQSAFQQCCCENRAGIADLKYTVANEGCADRNALAMATRDIIDNDNRNHQATMDKLCQLELDGYKSQLGQANDTINQLRTQLLVANNQASQNAQTATIQQGQRALANEIEQYIVPTPRPAYIVQNPNCCAPQYNNGYYQYQCPCRQAA